MASVLRSTEIHPDEFRFVTSTCSLCYTTQVPGFRRHVGSPNLVAIAISVRCQPFLSVFGAPNVFLPRRIIFLRKIGYTSRFVRVILAQGPC